MSRIGPTPRFRWLRLRPSLILIPALTLAGVGCTGKKVSDAPAQKACVSSQDCGDGWLCLAGRCADTRKSAAFTHPDQMLTPDKVRQEVEQQQQRHMRRIDKTLQDSDPSGN
jgi:hypothetical protein